MKPLNKYIEERLIVNKKYNIHPTTWDELRQIIEERYKELGPGTEQKPIDFNDIDVSEMNTFWNYIKNCGLFENTNFEYIDISDWDVSNVKDMFSMFKDCKSLQNIDLSSWDVSNVKDMRNMFTNCKEEIIPDWYKNRKIFYKI